MGWYGEAPYYASAEIIQEIVKRHLNSNAMMVILPIQDWLAMSNNCEKKMQNPNKLIFQQIHTITGITDCIVNLKH